MNDDSDNDIILCTDFKYSAHEGQLVIGDIFIQIYNEQPMFPIEVSLIQDLRMTIDLMNCFLWIFLFQNPKGFTLDLLEFLGKQSQCELTEQVIENMIMSMEALANVIKINPGVEIQCIGHFGLIFGLLSARSYPEVQKRALRVFKFLMANYYKNLNKLHIHMLSGGHFECWLL